MNIQYRQHYIKQQKQKAKRADFPSRCLSGYTEKKKKKTEQKVKDKQNVDGKVDGHRKANGLLGVYMTSFWHISNVISGESAF